MINVLHLPIQITVIYIMYAIFVLIVISLMVAIGFLVAFIWAAKNNQFDDDITPAVRILFDDTKPESDTTIDK